METASPFDRWLKEGVVLLDRYELVAPVAEGGMGIVWRALDRTLGASVAIKFSKSLDDAARWRFAEEARLAGRLASPHFVRVFDLGFHGNVPFLVMEFLEGQTLRELLLVHRKLPPALVVLLIRQIAEGLSVAHAAGVVHRDIKPGNIFIVGRSEAPFVKLLDFGVAKFGPGEWTSTGSWLGTPHYVSPEQALDASEVDASADLWAVAVIAYECLTGRRPFEGSSAVRISNAILEARSPVPSELDRTIPTKFDAWVLNALHRHRHRRPRTALALADGLERALAPGVGRLSPSLTAEEETTRGSEMPPGSSGRLALGVLSLSLIAGLAGFMVGASAKVEASESRVGAKSEVPSDLSLGAESPAPCSTAGPFPPEEEPRDLPEVIEQEAPAQVRNRPPRPRGKAEIHEASQTGVPQGQGSGSATDGEELWRRRL